MKTLHVLIVIGCMDMVVTWICLNFNKGLNFSIKYSMWTLKYEIKTQISPTYCLSGTCQPFPSTWQALKIQQKVCNHIKRVTITLSYIYMFKSEKVISRESYFEKCCCLFLFPTIFRGRRDRDRMVDGFTTTYAIRAYHHWCCEFESRSGRGVQHYVIKIVSDLRKIGGFLWVLQFPPPIKLTATI